MDNKTDDAAKERSKAVNRAALRGVICVYLIYLGGSLIRDLLRGESTLSPALVWSAGLLFVLGGLGFGWYTWRRWKLDAEALQKPAEEEDQTE